MSVLANRLIALCSLPNITSMLAADAHRDLEYARVGEHRQQDGSVQAPGLADQITLEVAHEAAHGGEVFYDERRIKPILDLLHDTIGGRPRKAP